MIRPTYLWWRINMIFGTGIIPMDVGMVVGDRYVSSCWTCLLLWRWLMLPFSDYNHPDWCVLMPQQLCVCKLVTKCRQSAGQGSQRNWRQCRQWSRGDRPACWPVAEWSSPPHSNSDHWSAQHIDWIQWAITLSEHTYTQDSELCGVLLRYYTQHVVALVQYQVERH